MGWETSDRRSRLPPDWAATVRRILRRDGNRCRFLFPNGGRCPEITQLEVDHIAPSGSDEDSNLQVLCKRHHAMKTSREGSSALAAKRAAVSKKFRRSEPHPGLRV